MTNCNKIKKIITIIRIILITDITFKLYSMFDASATLIQITYMYCTSLSFTATLYIFTAAAESDNVALKLSEASSLSVVTKTEVYTSLILMSFVSQESVSFMPNTIRHITNVIN